MKVNLVVNLEIMGNDEIERLAILYFPLFMRYFLYLGITLRLLRKVTFI